VPSSLRILFAWSPAAIVLLGILLLSGNGEPGAPDAASELPVEEEMQSVSAADQDRVHRIALKQETVIDLLDRRLTVHEAVQRFLEISSSDPESLDHLRKAVGDTDEEKALHQLIAFARTHANRNAARFQEGFEHAQQVAQSIQASSILRQ
jgi:hypothetical protein